MVLAAGAGRRLQPLTDDLPKTLLPVEGERTILDVVLSNLRQVGLEEVVVITGFAAHRVTDIAPELERRHNLNIELLFNPRAEEWNNAYSLWCAREHFGKGVLLVNGDTVHPVGVEESVLAARGSDDLVLAVDREKPLGEEEMKVKVSDLGHVQHITKHMDASEAQGEYIGVTLIEPAAAEALTEALEVTWKRDPDLYYEDGFQEFADRGGLVGTAPIGTVDWVEVDDHDDLKRAREVACRY